MVKQTMDHGRWTMELDDGQKIKESRLKIKVSKIKGRDKMELDDGKIDAVGAKGSSPLAE